MIFVLAGALERQASAAAKSLKEILLTLVKTPVIIGIFLGHGGKLDWGNDALKCVAELAAE